MKQVRSEGRVGEGCEAVGGCLIVRLADASVSVCIRIHTYARDTGMDNVQLYGNNRAL